MTDRITVFVVRIYKYTEVIENAKGNCTILWRLGEIDKGIFLFEVIYKGALYFFPFSIIPAAKSRVI